MPASFLGTNILVYIASGDAAKASQAEAVVAGGGATSMQDLNELANVARREMRMSWNDTHTLLSMLRGLVIVHPVTFDTQEAGLAAGKQHDFFICNGATINARQCQWDG